MNLSLYSGATGMQAQQLNLNVISNNIANVNTTGYKKNKIEFQDLLYQNPRQAGGQTGAGNVIPTGVEMGNGTKVVSTAKIFTFLVTALCLETLMLSKEICKLVNRRSLTRM